MQIRLTQNSLEIFSDFFYEVLEKSLRCFQDISQPHIEFVIHLFDLAISARERS